MDEKLAQPFELDFVEAQKLCSDLSQSLGLVALLRPHLKHAGGAREHRIQSVAVAFGNAVRGSIALGGTRQHSMLMRGRIDWG